MAYFYAIWLWFLWVIPLLLVITFLVCSVWWRWKKVKWNSLFNDYGLFAAWLIIMIWLFLILNFFDISIINSFLFLISVNLLFFLWSYLFKYDDWKFISQAWFYFSVSCLCIYTWIVFGLDTCIQVFSWIWWLYLAVIGITVFLLGLWYEIEDYMNYMLTILIAWWVVLILYNLIPNTLVFLITLCVCLALLYGCINYILAHKPPTQTQVQEISVRRILEWERVLKDIPQYNEVSKKIFDFVNEAPQFVKYTLEFTNTLIVLVLIYLYFKNALSLQWTREQLYYWLILVWFLFNVYLLKRINYTSMMQRLLTFLVINFAIYVSLFAAFPWDIWVIVSLWIAWNILSSIVIFRVQNIKLWQYLRKSDYLFWIFSTILALIVNIILLFNAWLSWQLLFPIILLYSGTECMILYYSAKFVSKIEEVEEDEDDLFW
jgi:hypothetical protein